VEQTRPGVKSSATSRPPSSLVLHGAIVPEEPLVLFNPLIHPGESIPRFLLSPLELASIWLTQCESRFPAAELCVSSWVDRACSSPPFFFKCFSPSYKRP